MAVIPALVDASRDRRLRGAPVHVLLYLHSVLEYSEARVLKHWAVAKDTGLQRQTVSKAIKRLVETGYLVEGERLERNVAKYRLRPTCPDPLMYPVAEWWK